MAVDGGATATYTYDAEGKRVEKVAGSTTIDYLYSLDGHVITEAGSGGAWNAGYVYAGGQLVAEYASGRTRFVHPDHLGSTRLLTNLSSSVCESNDFLPFGESNGTSGSCSTTHEFTGKERDSESGLDNFGARYNSSQYGRFMTPDPMLNSGRPDDPQSWNRYSYTSNNPLRYTDPTGLWKFGLCHGTDNECQTDEDRFRNSMSKLNNAIDKMKDGVEKARLQASMKALGTENDGNNVTVGFGPVANGAAQTDPVYNQETGQETYNVTMDPSKIGNKNEYAIDAAHEGTHISDFQTELANPSGQPKLGLFSLEYRGYQTSAWAAQALGYENISFRGVQIWNSSWGAVDRQTLQDRGITKVVVDKDHPETTRHNPWPN